ncbi:MAG: aspartate carbamoyltransferase catalytic subunit [Thermoguttaceae bacterium]|nr:aspartate carbamoyltransferase catalytic subunit [Thermoguttaceae bacterium]
MLYTKENWGPVPSGWTRPHLLGLQDLSVEELTILLDLADRFRKDVLDNPENQRKIPLLNGKAVVNLFFENSTRTRVSFGLAGRRLGADMIEFSAATSSLSKGETLVDTAQNILAMGVDGVVVRHSCPGAPRLLAENLQNCAVVNAGDGAHEHPTQGLLDLLTMRQRLGSLEGKTVAIVGDIAHSRVARSNVFALQKLGAKPIVCGPSTLVSPRWAELGVEYAYSLDEILPRVDVFNLLRIQLERQVVRPFPSLAEYAHLYAMNAERLARCKKDVLILAPGPINRGVEITPEVADGPQSAILDQVTNGVAVRMAALWATLTAVAERRS